MNKYYILFLTATVMYVTAIWLLVAQHTGHRPSLFHHHTHVLSIDNSGAYSLEPITEPISAQKDTLS